jgi:hypothetical protein
MEVCPHNANKAVKSPLEGGLRLQFSLHSNTATVTTVDITFSNLLRWEYLHYPNSRYSDWLGAGLRGWNSSPGRVKNFLFHSTPTSAKVKKMWIYTCTPPYAFMVNETLRITVELKIMSQVTNCNTQISSFLAYGRTLL